MDDDYSAIAVDYEIDISSDGLDIWLGEDWLTLMGEDVETWGEEGWEEGTEPEPAAEDKDFFDQNEENIFGEEEESE